MNALMYIIPVVFFAAISQILMKHGMNKIGKISLKFFLKKFFKIVFNPFVFSGLAISLVGTFFWLIALSKLDVSGIYPLISLSYVLTAFLAFVVLKENINKFRWIGIALIVIGCLLLLK